MNQINPQQIKIYHITHINNLASIIADGRIWSDYQRIQRNVGNTNIGYPHIKDRRMQHPVTVAHGGTLGHYVPFNFCPRSVMLYVVNMGHDNYPGGQKEVVHLVSSIGTVITANRPWFFTDRHPDTRELKQAEFLVHDFLPWTCVEQIGVLDNTVLQRVQNIINSGVHHPPVIIEPGWYY